MNTPDKNDVVIIELDKPRELRLGHKAMKRFSALTGCSMIEIDDVTAHYDKLSALMYIMLSEQDDELTTEAVDDLLDNVKLSYIISKAVAAMEAAFDDEDAKKENAEDGDTPPTAAGTGTKA